MIEKIPIFLQKINILTALVIRGVGMVSAYSIIILMPIWIGGSESGLFFYTTSIVAWLVFVFRSQVEPVIYNKICVDIKSGNCTQALSKLGSYNSVYAGSSLLLVIVVGWCLRNFYDWGLTQISLLLLLPLQFLLMNYAQLLICLGKAVLGYSLSLALPNLLIIAGCYVFLKDVSNVYHIIVLLGYLISVLVIYVVVFFLRLDFLKYKTLDDMGKAEEEGERLYSLTKMVMAVLQQSPINFPIIMIGYFYTEYVSEFTQVHKLGLVCSLFLSVCVASKTSKLIDVVKSNRDFISFQVDLRVSIYKFNIGFLFCVFSLYQVFSYYALIDVDFGVVALLLACFSQIIAARAVGCGLYLIVKKQYVSIILVSISSLFLGMLGFSLLVFYNVVLAGAALAAIYVSVSSMLSLALARKLEFRSKWFGVL